MANCNRCGRDAGYLKSLCNACFEGGPAAAGPMHAMPKPAPMVLEGLQGKTLTVVGDSIRIAKAAGMWAEKREKTIPIRQITSIEVKAPSTFVGFIQFSIAGGKVNDSSYTVTGGAFAAVTDENSVTFLDPKCYSVALKIKEHIESWKPESSATIEAPVAALSTADELLKFAELLDRGLLTRAEFDQKKKQLLGL